MIGRGRVNRRDRGFKDWCALGRRYFSHRLHDSREVCGGGATTSTHCGDAVVSDKASEVLGETFGGEVVVHLAVNDAGQSRIRQTRQGNGRGVRQRAQWLVHFYRPGGAVKTQHVNAHRKQGGNGRPNFRAGQHAPSEFDRHLCLNRHDAPVSHHRSVARRDGGLAGE